MIRVHFQTDDDATREAASLASGIDFSNEEDLTRQEFKDECDINWLLKRYGALPPSNPVQYGEQDMNLDLLSAYEAVQAAETAFANLDPSKRAQFATWRDLAQALVDGTLPTSPVNLTENSPSGTGEELVSESGTVAPPAGKPSAQPNAINPA